MPVITSPDVSTYHDTVSSSSTHKKGKHNMKRKSAILALAVVVLSVTAVQAVPTTYVYTGNPFTDVTGPPYTTSDRVTGMVTLASPFVPNAAWTTVTPLAFSFSDGVADNHESQCQSWVNIRIRDRADRSDHGLGHRGGYGCRSSPDSITTFLPVDPLAAFDRGHLAGFSTPTGKVSTTPGFGGRSPQSPTRGPP